MPLSLSKGVFLPVFVIVGDPGDCVGLRLRENVRIVQIAGRDQRQLHAPGLHRTTMNSIQRKKMKLEKNPNEISEQ